MIKLTRNPLRWVLALVLVPVMPFLVLLVANFGKDCGEKVSTMMMPVLLENPWMLLPLAGFGPALFFGFLVHLFFTPSCANKNSKDAEAVQALGLSNQP